MKGFGVTQDGAMTLLALSLGAPLVQDYTSFEVIIACRVCLGFRDEV